MAKLIFRYSAMKSGKSAEAIQVIQNYQYGGKQGYILSPSIDTAANAKIKSRLAGGLEAQAISFLESENLFELIKKEKQSQQIDYVLVDEANFLTRKQVDELGEIVDMLKINVLAYGITTGSDTTLFEGSKRLFETADIIEQTTIRSICRCGHKAIFNIRLIDGVIDDCNEVIIDAKDGKKNSSVVYTPMCRKCYYEAKKKEQ